MERTIFTVLIILIVGCTGMVTKWECESPPCLPRERAIDKCLAQTGSTLGKCMRAQGYRSVPCDETEKGSEECRLSHAW